MELIHVVDQVSFKSPIFNPHSFERDDETDDQEFYKFLRMIDHLDSIALETVTEVIKNLIIEDRPVILDLMAGWNSHISLRVNPLKLVELGLYEEELNANKTLGEYIIHDINKDPTLPFNSNSFDVVLNTLSVQYITRPLELFKEVGRMLKPKGLFLVIFSNRMFYPKAVRPWKESSEEERIILVDEYFKASGLFEATQVFVSRFKPRPKDDKYAALCRYSDPVYAFYAQRLGGDPSGPGRPGIETRFIRLPPKRSLKGGREK